MEYKCESHQRREHIFPRQWARRGGGVGGCLSEILKRTPKRYKDNCYEAPTTKQHISGGAGGGK